MKATQWKLRRISKKIDAKDFIIFQGIPEVFIYTPNNEMPSFIPSRNSSVIKFIYDAVSRNSSRVSVHLQKPKKTIYKKIVGHPDIFGPHYDCGACGGGGCGHCR